MSEKGPIGTMRRKSRRNVPIDPNERYEFASRSGRSSAKIFDPSRGGIGKRLKIARRRLSLSIFEKIKFPSSERVVGERVVAP
jgi:hypothetical protein